MPATTPAPMRASSASNSSPEEPCPTTAAHAVVSGGKELHASITWPSGRAVGTACRSGSSAGGSQYTAECGTTTVSARPIACVP